MDQLEKNHASSRDEMNDTCEAQEKLNLPKMRFTRNNVTVLDYRRELASCKGKVKIKGRKKSEAVKKRRALKKALKRKQLIKEGHLQPSKKTCQEICRLHRSGRCMKDNKCQYNHPEIIEKKPEICQRYLNGFCPRGTECRFMHGEFPCKFYHLGYTCFARNDCLFSHAPLNEISRQILLNHMSQANKKPERLKKAQDDLKCESSSATFPVDSNLVNSSVSAVDENSCLKLNFYVDTLSQNFESVTNKPVMHELDVEKLFLHKETDKNVAKQSCGQDSSRDQEKIFSPPSPVFVRRGRILPHPKRAKRTDKMDQKNNKAVASSLNLDNTVNGSGEKNKSSDLFPVLLLNPGFSSLFLLKQTEEAAEVNEMHKRFLFKTSDMVNIAQLQVEKISKSFESHVN